MPGWTARLAVLVLALGGVALLLVLLQWFTAHDGWTLGLALAFLLLVALPAAVGTLALVVGHHLRGQRAPPRTWVTLGAGLAMLAVGMGFVTGAVPREVLNVPVEVIAYAQGADATVNITLTHREGKVVGGASASLKAEQVPTRLGFMPMPPGAYELRVDTDDGRSASATIRVGQRALEPRVLVTPSAIDIRQDHGD